MLGKMQQPYFERHVPANLGVFIPISKEIGDKRPQKTLRALLSNPNHEGYTFDTLLQLTWIKSV